MLSSTELTDKFFQRAANQIDAIFFFSMQINKLLITLN